MYKLKWVSVREKHGNGLRLVPTPFSTCRAALENIQNSKKKNTQPTGRNREVKSEDVSLTQTDT